MKKYIFYNIFHNLKIEFYKKYINIIIATHFNYPKQINTVSQFHIFVCKNNNHNKETLQTL
jgi:hypothetical protein